MSLKLESKDSPYYSHCLHDQGVIYSWYEEYEESVECFERGLEEHYRNEGNSSLDQLGVLLCTRNMAYILLLMGKCEKARLMLEKTIEEHDEIYGNAIGKIFWSTDIRCHLLLTLGRTYYDFGDVRSALETFKKVEQMQIGLTNISDMDAIQLNSFIAMSFDRLHQHAQSLEYMQLTLQLAQKVFGENNLSITLVGIYGNASVVFEHCNQNDEAPSLITRSLKLVQLLFGDNPHPGKMVT